MKFYKPLFSIIVILVQLILSLMDHYEHIEAMEKLKREDPEFYGLIDFIVTYDTLFLFVLIIGFYEMTTKPGLFKSFLRVFLVCIILGTQFSGLIPIEDFYFGVYNTAWFSSVLAFMLILTRIGKESFNRNKLKKASR